MYKKKDNKRTDYPKKYNHIEVDGSVAYIFIHSRKYGLKIATIDADDVSKVEGYTWSYSQRGYIWTNKKVSEKRKPNGRFHYRPFYLHHAIIDTPYWIDHISGIKEDNRKSNLRTGKTLQESILINGGNRKAYKCDNTVVRGIRIAKWKDDDVMWYAQASIRNRKKIFNKRFYGKNSFYEAFKELEYWRRNHITGYIPVELSELTVNIEGWIERLKHPEEDEIFLLTAEDLDHGTCRY